VTAQSPVLTDAARAAMTAPRPETGVESRAETQLGGEASTRPPAKSSNASAIVFGVLGVLALAGGAAAFVLRGSAAASAPEPVKAKAAMPAPPAVSPEPPAQASVTPPVPSAAPAPSGVRLEVVTDPPGVTLLKNGFQVCDATPCEVTAAVNETLELSAEKGPLKGKAKVLAQNDQKVTIKLVAPVAAPKQQRMCEVEVDGLKILRPCP
jgi:hypothetical protein